MRSHSYLHTAKGILTEYGGTGPFALWIKQFFKQDKKYGSNDRREIAHLCYSFFRIGSAFSGYSTEERMLIGLFLSSSNDSIVLRELKPDWNEKLAASLADKLRLIDAEEEIKKLFAYADALSDRVDPHLFGLSFLTQPLLYLRVRPGREYVLEKLQKQQVAFTVLGAHCIGLPNSTKVDGLVELDKEAVVQDYNSQRVLDFPHLRDMPAKSLVWDCCAASGGKSILAYDTLPAIHLTVSDIRESILQNLEKRFRAAGISHYNRFVIDLSVPYPKPRKPVFDLILCDAPCTGSGTWSRTPEQMYFFKEEKLSHYAQLQKTIVANAAKSVKPGGYFLYITCSVFKMENEGVVDFIQEHLPLQLLSATYFTGFDKKADTLFAALFRL